jgi:hypothetical protein
VIPNLKICPIFDRIYVMWLTEPKKIAGPTVTPPRAARNFFSFQINVLRRAR